MNVKSVIIDLYVNWIKINIFILITYIIIVYENYN